MDDNTDKTNRVKSVLTGMCMVNADNIEIARSLNSGRHKLSKNLYDLLLLDLVLPVNDDEPIEPGINPRNAGCFSNGIMYVLLI